MNVLKRIIIPKIEHTIRYIRTEMEELEREDTFRLKRVKQNNVKRARQKMEQDGAGERIEAVDIKKEDKLETKTVAPEKPDIDKDSESKDKDSENKDKDSENIDKESENKDSMPVQPKEAAEMGDLIVIKAPNDVLQTGDTLVPTGLNNMAVTEAEELIDLTEYDENEKDKIEDVIEEPVAEIAEVTFKKDPVAETEVIFDENVTKDVVYDDLEAGEWFETETTAANVKESEYSKMDKYEDVLGTKRESDESIASVDLDKRGIESLFKSIDSNYYKPSIDDLFSKHDIAMKDDVDESNHSLVDLESIDFSLDSLGKVVMSPALSHHGEGTKQHVKYNEGYLVRPSITKEDNHLTEDSKRSKEDNKAMKDKESIEPKVDKNDGTDLGTSDLTENSNVNISHDLQQTTNIDKVDQTGATETRDDQNTKTENISNNKLAQSKLKLDDMATTGKRISRSISDVKLSRIAKENLEVDRSKLSTLVEEPVELRENDKTKAQTSDNNLLDDETRDVEIEKASKHSVNIDQQNTLNIDDVPKHSRDIQSTNNQNMIQRVSTNQDVPNTLNPIAEEEEILSDIHETDGTVKVSFTVPPVITNDKDKLESVATNAYNDYNKDIKDLEDRNLSKSNDTLDVETKSLQIRDSTELTKSKLDVSKLNWDETDKDIKREVATIQLKRKSQVKHETEEQLRIKSSNEMIETKQDNNEGTDKAEDQKEKDREGETKSKETEQSERDDRDTGDDASHSNRQTGHGDEHLKQD